MNVFLTFILIVQALFIFRFHFDISAISPFIKPLPLLRKVTDPFIKPLTRQLKDPNQAQIVPIIVGTLLTLAFSLLVGMNQPINALGAGMSLFFRNWLNIIVIMVLVNVIMSWVGLFKIQSKLLDNVRYFAFHFCEPMLAPLRRLLPPMGGLDLSPMLLIIGINLLYLVL